MKWEIFGIRSFRTSGTTLPEYIFKRLAYLIQSEYPMYIIIQDEMRYTRIHLPMIGTTYSLAKRKLVFGFLLIFFTLARPWARPKFEIQSLQVFSRGFFFTTPLRVIFFIIVNINITHTLKRRWSLNFFYKIRYWNMFHTTRYMHRLSSRVV